MEIKFGEEFKPSPYLKKVYYIYFVITIVVGILTWYIPFIIASLEYMSYVYPAVILITLGIVSILGFVLYWIPKYYDSIRYVLEKDEIVWERGVWFKRTGIVPYNRITNIDIVQGPIYRHYGIATLKIQTAGYSGRPGAETRIDGVENYEELRNVILKMVHKKRAEAVEVYEEADEGDVLHELRVIRKLLEDILKKLG